MGRQRKRPALLFAVEQGWTVEWTQSDHLKLTHPHAASPVFMASTPSCGRADRNAIAELRRALAKGRIR